ncbi:uncharacterized protein LOC131052785 [Cryptomeria japonica]|uniref:uncharacterized protein LOC131052785 n=1 Tax=Cryptomeria japonica TaxID=3369 RepID=UPI0027DA9DD4|nr:uncharacterized protein LOC131052785 [Cryptomeria japonica]
MAFEGYKKSPSGEEENPFYKINTKDNGHGHGEIMNADEQEEKQWDDLILKMVDMSVDDAKMGRALKRQLDWALQKLGIERNNISSPKTNKVGEEKCEPNRQVLPKYSPPHMRRMDQPFVTYDNSLMNENRRWRDVHRDQSEERSEDERRNGDRGDDGTWNNTSRGNHVGNNGFGSNQNNRHNRGNNDSYGNANGGSRNNNNGNNSGGRNNGNNRNYDNNGGFNRGVMNNQNNHHVGRQPLIIERYK